jgi:branched-chain amino acid transport system ATP-binding protein
MSAAAPLLEIANLDVAHGDVRAVSGVSLTVGAGEIVALLGPNGAGKSTLLNCAAGLLRPRAGAVRFDGEDLTGVHAHEIVQRGLALVPEGRRLFGGMTVEDNLELGAFAERARAGRQASLERVLALFPALAERRRQIVAALSGGQQQMVAVGRALMTNPRLLMLDEPSLGLAPTVVRELFATVRRLNEDDGLTVLVVEQNARIALDVASRAYVPEVGKVAVEGTSDELARHESVRKSYLGY